MAENAVAEIGILEEFARRVDEDSVAQNRVVHRRVAVVFVGIEKLPVQREARSVAQNAAEVGAGGVASQASELCGTEVIVGRRVEAQLAFLHQLHDGGRGERLADGGERIHRVGSCRLELLAVCPAETLLPNDFSVLRDGYSDGGQLVFLDELENFRALGLETGIRGSDTAGLDGHLRRRGQSDCRRQGILQPVKISAAAVKAL